MTIMDLQRQSTRDALLRILNSIRPYASWNRAALKAAYESYKQILLEVAGPAQNRPDLDFLVSNLIILEQCLADGRDRPAPEPYNMASDKLRCDIDMLLEQI